MTRLLSSKLFALVILIGVGVWLLLVPALAGRLGANPLEKLLHQTGDIAIWTLGAVLALTPLRSLFPQSKVVAALNRHRRMIGITACVYGLLHFTCHLLYEGDWDSIRESFGKPFTWFGLAGLTILVILALTSNNWAMRKLGGRSWKGLHRLAYLAIALLIYHESIAGKGHWHDARWLFYPLVGLEVARLIKTHLFKPKISIYA